MFHKVKNVETHDNCILGVYFLDGTVKMYDVKKLFDSFPMFGVLRDNEVLFNSVKVDQGGYGISWNDDLDLSCDELYYESD